MDTADYVAVYGILGGMATGLLNTGVYPAGGFPKTQKSFYLRYFALFGSMGCISAVILHAALPDVSAAPLGVLGGAIGSYVLLGVGNYM